jgi:hypothetical protein
VAQPYVPSGRYIATAPEFFDRLDDAKLPETLRSPIHSSLTVLLEDDEETVTPDTASFTTLLRFLAQHRDLPAPAIGVNPTGKFVAGWQDRALRFTLEFLSADYVRWVRVEDVAGKKRVDGGLTFADQVSLPPRMPQNIAA